MGKGKTQSMKRKQAETHLGTANAETNVEETGETKRTRETRQREVNAVGIARADIGTGSERVPPCAFGWCRLLFVISTMSSCVRWRLLMLILRILYFLHIDHDGELSSLRARLFFDQMKHTTLGNHQENGGRLKAST